MGNPSQKSWRETMKAALQSNRIESRKSKAAKRIDVCVSDFFIPRRSRSMHRIRQSMAAWPACGGMNGCIVVDVFFAERRGAAPARLATLHKRRTLP